MGTDNVHVVFKHRGEPVVEGEIDHADRFDAISLTNLNCRMDFAIE